MNNTELLNLLKDLEHAGRYVQYADGECNDECPMCGGEAYTSDYKNWNVHHEPNCKLKYTLEWLSENS